MRSIDVVLKVVRAAAYGAFVVAAGVPRQAWAGEAAADPDEVTLKPVKVKAAALRDATTEGSGSYAPSAVSIGKDTRALREVPHAVTVITREQLDDQHIVSIEAALKNVTGVTVQRFDATGAYTQFMARGYAADTYLLDGLALQTDTNGIYFDLAAYDRVEVQRGAAGLFTGAGEPAVTVNLARKRALPGRRFDAAVSLGSWNDRRVDLDATGTLNAAGSLRGRAVAVVQDYDTFMDGIDNNRKRLLYGTLEADVADRTTLSIGATWQNVDTVLSRGLPTRANGQLIDMPRATMPVQSWNRQTLDSQSAFAEVEHRGQDDALLKFSVRHVRRGNDATYLDPSIPAADGTMSALTASAFARVDTDESLDLYYSKPFQWAGQRHNVLVGADYREAEAKTRYAGVVPLTGGSLNLFRFDPTAIAEPAFNLDASRSDTKIRAHGAYTQLRLKPAAEWTLIGGGRLSAWRSEGVSYGTASNYENKNEFTPYAAALYDIGRAATVYASYNEIFKPQNARTAAGEQIAPRTGRQYELGLKGELAQGRLAYSGAVYRLEDNHRAVADAANPQFSVALGKARVEGAEFDVRGDLSPRWSLSGGYAYNFTRYLNTAQQGQPVSTFTPKHNYNLWVRHRVVEGGRLGGLTAGVGLRGMSDFYNVSGSTVVRGPGYALFALSLAYPIHRHYKVSLNIDNLFDKVYWEKVSTPSRQNFFGEPRRITVALRGSF